MVSAPILAAVALAASSPAALAFAPTFTRVGGAAGPLCAMDEASAQALSNYMAKSHEEKLRAVKELEDKKNEEIAALKAEIKQLKISSALAVAAPSTPAPSAVVPSSVLATSELESKIESYRSFMTEYIVNAQNQKLLAVKEAELKAEKKFQERLEKLFEAGGMVLPSSGSVVEAAPVVVEETLFQKRNKEIVAAGAAGKSRWGDKEIERAKEQVNPPPTGAVAAAASSFDLRNAAVSAAGAKGKSRWGDMEVSKANGAVEAKKQLTLEDRVNLGARLLS